MTYKELYDKALWELEHNNITLGEFDKMIEPLNKEIPAESEKAELKEEFEREIEIANKDIDLMPEQEDYMRGYLGGILCAYRIVFGKNYEESEEEE